MTSGAKLKYILFTDIWRSSALWESHPRFYPVLLETHNELTENTVATHGGEVMKNLGDGYIALFDSAVNAVQAAAQLQLGLCGKGTPETVRLEFPDGSALAIRAIVHAGPLHLLAVGHGMFGTPLNRAARMCKLCRPGQILVSATAKAGLTSRLPAELELFDGGKVKLRGLNEPERIFVLTHPALPRMGFSRLARYVEGFSSTFIGFLLFAGTLTIGYMLGTVSPNMEVQTTVEHRELEVEDLRRQNREMLLRLKLLENDGNRDLRHRQSMQGAAPLQE